MAEIQFEIVKQQQHSRKDVTKDCGRWIDQLVDTFGRRWSREFPEFRLNYFSILISDTNIFKSEFFRKGFVA